MTPNALRYQAFIKSVKATSFAGGLDSEDG